jgi:hypothetical protein
MSATDPGLDDALNRLITILEGGGNKVPGPGPGSPPPGGGAGTGTGVGTKPLPATGSGTPANTLQQQRSDVARIQLYLQGMPILTPERVAELEKSLPELIATLESLGYRPSLRRSIIDVIEGGKSKGGDRSASDDTAMSEFVKLVQSDLAADGERVAPALALGLFMAAYTIVKQWRA